MTYALRAYSILDIFFRIRFNVFWVQRVENGSKGKKTNFVWELSQALNLIWKKSGKSKIPPSTSPHRLETKINFDHLIQQRITCMYPCSIFCQQCKASTRSRNLTVRRRACKNTLIIESFNKWYYWEHLISLSYLHNISYIEYIFNQVY